MDSNYPGEIDANFNIKEEFQAISSSPPQPVEGLQTSRPPPFLTKTYDMVEDPLTNSVVSWSLTHNSFIVWNSHQFSMDLLPKYFKHNNFSSFVRQLNTYGFRKVDPDRWEFANEGFLRGQRHLLKHIQRRRPPSQGQLHQQGMGACVEVGQFGMDGEIERLRRDKGVLMREVVRLRQQQQSTRTQLQTMAQRMHVAEQRQQQMMTFLARAMRNPTFLSQLVQKNHVNKHLAGAKKRRRLPQGAGGHIDQPLPQSSRAQGQMIKYHDYSRSAPSEPPGTPLEDFFSSLGQADPVDEYQVAQEPFHEDALRQEEEVEGLISPNEFEQLQGFEHETAAFGDTVSLGIAAASGRGSSSSLAGNRDNNDSARPQDLELQTTDVFWEELLGDEFDSQDDSESDVEPSS